MILIANGLLKRMSNAKSMSATNAGNLNGLIVAPIVRSVFAIIVSMFIVKIALKNFAGRMLYLWKLMVWLVEDFSLMKETRNELR